jgi:hypothetical protein
VSRASRERRRQRRAFDQLLDEREVVIVRDGETAISIPGVGAIFISHDPASDYTTIEAIALSGPGVAERKAKLDELMREAGLGGLVDERDARARSAA